MGIWKEGRGEREKEERGRVGRGVRVGSTTVGGKEVAREVSESLTVLQEAKES